MALPAYQGVPGVPVPPTGGAGHDLLHPLIHALANVGSLGTYQNPGATTQYLSDLARSLNPLTTEGKVNLAGIIVPGGRGNGRIDPMQDMYLNQLNTVQERSYPMGHSMKAAPAPESVLSKADVNANPNLRAIAERLGHTYGDPLGELYLNSAHDPVSAAARLSHKSDLGYPAAKAQAYMFWARGNAADHMQLIQRLLAKNAINRRN